MTVEDRAVKRIFIIGIGAGDPEHMTVQAINALREPDVLFVTNKRQDTADLVGLRTAICERYLSGRPYRLVEITDPQRDREAASYRAAVELWHEQRAIIYEDLIDREIGRASCRERVSCCV